MLIQVCGACGKAMGLGDRQTTHRRTGVACHAGCEDAPVAIRIDNERQAYKAIERILQHLGIHD